MANSERRVTYAFCPDIDTFARGLIMIERITRLEAQNERSFTKALPELQKMQKDRREKTKPHPHPEPPPPTDDPPQYIPAYVSTAAATDTR